MAYNPWIRVATLLYLIFLTRLTIDLYLPSLADIQLELGASIRKVKLTMSLYMAGFGISTLLSGILARRFGRKNILLISLAAYVIISFLCSQANNINHLIILRFLLGFTAGAGTIIGRLIVDKHFTDYEKIKVLSYMSTVAALSPAILPMLGGMINDVYGWRVVYYFICCAGLVGFYAVSNNVKKAEYYESYQIKETFYNFILLLKNRTFVLLMFVNSCAWGLLFVYSNSSTFIFQDIFNLSASEYASYFALSAFGYALGSMAVRIYAKKFALENIIITISIIALITSSILLIYSYFYKNNEITYTAFYFVILSTSGICLPSCQALNLDRFRFCSSDALSLHFFIQLVSVALLSMIINSYKFDIENILIVSTFVLSFIIFVASVILKKFLEKT